MIHVVRNNLVRHVAGEENYYCTRLSKNIFLINTFNTCGVARGCSSGYLSEIKKNIFFVVTFRFFVMTF